jgi:benzoyl-CoA reductase subunit C
MEIRMGYARSPVLDRCRRLLLDPAYRAGVLRKVRQTRRGVVGFFSNYIPEEWLYACDLVPTRLFGLQEHRSRGGGTLPSFYCTYVRDVFASAEEGLHTCLDAVIMPNTCDSLHGARDAWPTSIPSVRVYSFVHPIRQRGADAYYATQLGKLREEIEADFGVRPSPEDVRRAAETYNDNRRRLARLHDRRKEDIPPLGGADFVALVSASMILPKDEHQRMLDDLEGDLATAPRLRGRLRRLLVMGPVCDRVDLLDAIESLGAVVVTDALSNGTRYFLSADLEPPYDDSAFARRFTTQRVTPTVASENRWAHVMQAIEDYRVEGVIFLCQKQCDPHLLAWPVVRENLERRGVRSLLLEIEHGQVGFSREANAVEAFLETLA